MKILILLFLLLFSVINPAPVAAQKETSGYTLSPPFKEITLKNEASQASYFIEITNKTSKGQILYLSVVDFGSLNESGGVAFLGEKGEILERKYSLASWVSLEKDTLEVESGKSQKIKVTVINKESLSPGGHYAAVVSSTKSPIKEGGNVSLNTAFASLIFVKKTGGEIYELNLAGKEILSRSFGLPGKIALRFQNRGNVHVVPRGTVTVADSKGTIISRGIINPESGIILPESFRLYHTVLDRLNLPLLPGFYTLNIQYRHEGREVFTGDSFSFFYPGIAGIAVLVILILVIILILLRIRLRRNENH